MARCLLALGANLGDRRRSLDQALDSIGAFAGSQILARSAWHETAAVGGPAGQADFLNGAVLVDTSLTPNSLADALRLIEERLGRERKIRWDARTLDIDMLLYDGEIIDDESLEIPHPRMAYRQFVLAPAVEIAGEMLHPTSRWTIAALLHHWRTAPRTVAVVGEQGESLQWLQEAIRRELALQRHDHNHPNAIELVSGEQNPSMAISLQQAVGPTVCVKRLGPIVKCAGTDRAEALQEAFAAIHAAWPE